jgi:hypothetical protein
VTAEVAPPAVEAAATATGGCFAAVADSARCAGNQNQCYISRLASAQRAMNSGLTELETIGSS